MVISVVILVTSDELENLSILPKENCWTLPEDFTGSFSGRSKPGDAERIYDPETDTVFIQNQLQLLELQYESRGEDPVMSGDVDVNTFGTGMFVFTDDMVSAILSAVFSTNCISYSRNGLNDAISMTPKISSLAFNGTKSNDLGFDSPKPEVTVM